MVGHGHEVLSVDWCKYDDFLLASGSGVCVCVRARARVRLCACVRVRVRACMCMRVRACDARCDTQGGVLTLTT